MSTDFHHFSPLTFTRNIFYFIVLLDIKQCTELSTDLSTKIQMTVAPTLKRVGVICYTISRTTLAEHIKVASVVHCVRLLYACAGNFRVFFLIFFLFPNPEYIFGVSTPLYNTSNVEVVE